MALNYDLSNQQIKNTYEQLVQVSASALVDGTGSLVDSLDYVTNPTFTSYTSSTATSTSASIANLQTQIDSLEAGSGSADWSLITNKPDGIVSSSAQTIANLPSGTISGSSQVDYNSISNVPSGLVSSSAQISTDISGAFTSTSASIATDIATNKSDISTQTSRVDSLVSATSSYAVKTSNNTFTGTQTFDNISVNGTASIAVLQSVTGSAKIIGDAFIQLNTDTPAQRYAGLQVVDSGSTADTASLIWDSQTNDWFYEYEGDDPTDHGILLFGPEYGTKGSPAYPTNNVLQKGDGGHHLVDSSITDTGTSVSMSAPLTASGFQGDLDGTASFATSALTASFALNAGGGAAGLVAGTGTDSMESAADLTTTAADAAGARSIALGNNTSTDGADSVHIGSGVNPRSGQTTAETVAIGYNISGVGYSVQVGSNITNNGTGGVVALGRGITVNGDYGVAIGESATAGTGVAVGQNASVGSFNGVAVGNGASNGNNYATALGQSANANNDASIAIGAQVQAASNQSIAIGTEADVLGSSVGAIALGQGAQVTGTQAIGIGQGVSTSAANEINIGDIFKYDGTSAISLIGQVSSSLGFVGNGSGLTNVSATSASYAATASMASGNFKVDGQVFSPTFAGSVASSTSSIDFDNGNFATLSLTSATFLANPTNLKSGTTYTIILDSGSLISNHGTAWKFAGGTAPTYSNGTDVLTCVSDGTNLYATALTDFS